MFCPGSPEVRRVVSEEKEESMPRRPSLLLVLAALSLLTPCFASAEPYVRRPHQAGVEVPGDPARSLPSPRTHLYRRASEPAGDGDGGDAALDRTGHGES